MKTTEKFTKWQRIVCSLCFGAYLFAYLIRINISIALPDISSAMNLTTVETGSITSAFFWTYALGQLVSGWLGDRIPPRFMIGIGLGASSLINILFSFTQSLPLMITFWALNGAFQSMLWAPIMRTIVMNFKGKRLVTMTFAMSLTFVFGYSISWSASTIIKHFLGWRFVFILPAIIAIVFTIVWFFSYNPNRKIAVTAEIEEEIPSQTSLLRVKYIPLILVFLVFISMAHGIVKESINVWLPTMLESAGTFSMSSTLGVLLFVPFVNFSGILLMKTIMGKGNSNAYKTLILLFSISFAVAIAAFAVSKSSLTALIVVTIAMSGFMFATNPVLTAFVPLDFIKWNCVSTIAGFVDCAIYIGAALSGILTGFLVKGQDWSGVAAMWMAVLFAGIFFGAFLRFLTKRMNSHLQKDEEKKLSTKEH